MYLMRNNGPSRESQIDVRLTELIGKLVVGDLTPTENSEMQHLQAERFNLMRRRLFGHRCRCCGNYRPSTVRRNRHVRR